MKVLEYCSTCNRLFELEVVSEKDIQPDAECPICKRPIFPNNINTNEEEPAAK